MRSDCSASSGRTSKAGGVRRPARCSAASTSTISERRESSEPRISCSRTSSGRSRASASPIRVSTPRTWAAMSISCWLSLLRSWPIAAISALQFRLRFRGAFLLGAGGLEFLLALLDGVGRGGRRLRRGAATCADARQQVDAGKARRQQRDRERHADRRQPAAAGGVRVRGNVPRWLHRCWSALFRGCAARLMRGDRDGRPEWSRPGKSVPEA